MTPNEARDKADARCAADPELKAAARAAWTRVADAIESRAAKKWPPMKVFEVHHEMTTARAALLRAIAYGQSVKHAEDVARDAVGLASPLTVEEMLS